MRVGEVKIVDKYSLGSGRTYMDKSAFQQIICSELDLAVYRI